MLARLRLASLAVLVGALLVATPVAPASAAVESPGFVKFNDPFGSEDQQYALIRHIDRKIDRTPRRATIRVAAYSFAMPSTTDALIRAHRRGVVVKVVVDQHSTQWSAVPRLVRELGTNTRKRSFVRICARSCRGEAGAQHAKFVTISSTGRAEQLVMVGSMNFTGNAAANQWQDLYTVDRVPTLYRQLVTDFRQMVLDRPQRRLVLPDAGSGFKLDVAPYPTYRARTDPLLTRLDAVRCKGATGGTGRKGRTVVRVAMHGWNGQRGFVVAKRIGELAEKGCSVRVLAGVGFGPRVRNALERGGAKVRDSEVDGRATHQKLMVVSGRFARRTDVSYAWTGSHNFSDRSTRNDEVALRIAGARQVGAYLKHFDAIWRLAG